MSEHVQQSIKVYNQRLYLYQLKMSMSCDYLTVVFNAIVQYYRNCCMCTSPAWFSFISVEHLNLTQKLLDKAYKWGLTNRMYNAKLLFSTRDCQLFKLMYSSSHCLSK